jgi:hypothetical protein
MHHLVSAFWNDFSRLIPDLSAQPRSRAALESLLDSLRHIDERLYFHLRRHDKGTDLILSAEGNADLMDLLGELLASAPGMPEWKVIAAYDGDFEVGRRNEDVFPLTENGEVLYEMACNGDRLWVPRDIDFSFIFADETGAHSFAQQLSLQEIHASISEYSGTPGYSHEVAVSQHMLPKHDVISGVEARLNELAVSSGGKADGWGCMSEA